MDAGDHDDMNDNRTMRPTVTHDPGEGGARARAETADARILAGRYEVLGELGRGAMGVVYRCVDRVARIEVALKTVPKELAGHPGAIARLRENFRLVEGLHHPGIAALKTVEEDAAAGAVYVVMEYVEGLTLADHLRARGGRLSLPAALELVRPIAEALDFAHARRIIHRDLKPSNVIVTPRGQAKLLDFGIASHFQDSLSRLTGRSFETSGTRPYMAPEQWRGEYQNAATDQYALAVVLYEILAGRLPFAPGDPAALREAVLQDEPPRPDGLGEDVWQALKRGMAKQRSDRYATCLEFVAALERPAGGATASGRFFRAASALLLLVLAVLFLRPFVPDRPGDPAGSTPALRLSYDGTHPFPGEDFRAELHKELAIASIRLADGDAAPAMPRIECRVVEQSGAVEESAVYGVTQRVSRTRYRIGLAHFGGRAGGPGLESNFVFVARAVLEQKWAPMGLDAPASVGGRVWNSGNVAALASNVAAAVTPWLRGAAD